MNFSIAELEVENGKLRERIKDLEQIRESAQEVKIWFDAFPALLSVAEKLKATLSQYNEKWGSKV